MSGAGGAWRGHVLFPPAKGCLLARGTGIARNCPPPPCARVRVRVRWQFPMCCSTPPFHQHPPVFRDCPQDGHTGSQAVRRLRSVAARDGPSIRHTRRRPPTPIQGAQGGTIPTTGKYSIVSFVRVLFTTMQSLGSLRNAIFSNVFLFFFARGSVSSAAGWGPALSQLLQPYILCAVRPQPPLSVTHGLGKGGGDSPWPVPPQTPGGSANTS
eukprot:gene14591-biopygen11163